MTTTTQDRRGRAAWFIAWMAIGAGYTLGFLGALTIGPFVLILAAVASIFLGRRPAARVGLPGLVSGPSAFHSSTLRT